MIYALHHAPAETLGLIAGVLKGLHLDVREIHPYRGQAVPSNSPEADALILMGGPMNVDETQKYPFLAKEVDLIGKMIQDEKPVLGICLGSQLIAKALGSRVYPNKSREVGWHPLELTMAGILDPLFKNFPNNTDVFHWHGDTFDLPKGAVHLASTEKCRNQAFLWGKNVYALQFHLEVTPKMVLEWVEADEAYILGAKESPDDILEKTREAHSRLQPIAKNLFKTFFHRFALSPSKT